MALEPRNQVALSVPEVWRLAKPYQIEDCDFVVRNRRVVLGHQTGLGKTFISLLAWSKLPAYKTLIVGTLSSVYVWLSHLKDFAGIQPLVVQGRDPRWDVFLRGSEGVCLCTYATLRMLMSGFGRIRVDLLILDEIHRALRSRNTQIFRAVKRVDAQFVIGLSATWASRGPQDLWPMLNIISPKTFPSYWRFVETWCFVERGAFGVEVFGVRNAENLRTMLQSRYYRARKRSDVADQLGIKPGEAVVRQVVRLAMSPQQEALYRQLDSEMYVELGKERVVTPSVLAKLTRLMQLAISPATLFKGSEPGPAIEYVVDKIAEDRHVVVFCPFKSGLDVLSAQLASSLPEVQVFRLEGGTDPKIIDSVIRD
ncbi:MAG: DEAD/DEAH box helicase [Nitrososphaerota archaeon]